MKYVAPIYLTESEAYWLSSDGLRLVRRFVESYRDKAGASPIVLTDRDEICTALDRTHDVVLELRESQGLGDSRFLPSGGLEALSHISNLSDVDDVTIANFRALSVDKALLKRLGSELNEPDVDCAVGIVPCRDNPFQLSLRTKVLLVERISGVGPTPSGCFDLNRSGGTLSLSIDWGSLDVGHVIVRGYALNESGFGELLMETTDRAESEIRLSDSDHDEMVVCALQVTSGGSHYMEPFRPIGNLWKQHRIHKKVAIGADGKPITGRQWAPDVRRPANIVSAVSSRMLDGGGGPLITRM